MPKHDSNSPGARALRDAGFFRLPRHWGPREMRDEVVARAEKYLTQINHIRQEAEDDS